MASFTMKVDFPTDAELDRMFDMVGAMHRYGAADKVVRAMGKIVLTRAKAIVQSTANSALTGSRDKWSLEMKAAYSHIPHLYDALRLVMRKTSKLAYAIVGPMWREGNAAYYNLAYKKGTREVVYWGKPQGRSVQAIRNWMLQACDETKPQQVEAAKTELRRFLKDTYGA